MRQLPLSIQLDDSATFANFLSADNALSVQALKANVTQPQELIYIWGSQETGKTHLAQAVCHAAATQAKTAVYLPLDNPDLDASVLEGMDIMALVCLDNIDSVMGDQQWEQAIFNLYNDIRNSAGSLIVFASQPPKELAVLLPDLQSRFAAMTVFQLREVNDEQKISLMQTRAKSRGFELSDEVVRFIINRFGRSIRELIAILDRLDHSSIVLKRKITIPLVKQILQ